MKLSLATQPFALVGGGLAMSVVTALLAPSALGAQPENAPPGVQVIVAEPLPLPVTVSNLPASRKPVMIQVSEICPINGFGCNTTIYTVPEGMRFTLQSVSFFISKGSENDDVVAPFLATTFDGTVSQFEFGQYSEAARVGGNTGTIITSHQVTLYAEAGTDVRAGYLRDLPSSGAFGYDLFVTASGYLEPVD